MSKLILIRHAQASFLADDYDQLSPLGEQQAAILGKYLATKKANFDALYVGKLRRQQQTANFVGEAYQNAGLSWETPIIKRAFDEHEGTALVQTYLPKILKERNIPASAIAPDSPIRKRVYFKIFFEVMHRWMRNEINMEGVEPWQAFRKRVQDGLQMIIEKHQKGQTVGVFTSGGTIGCMVGLALATPDIKMMDLNDMVLNTSRTEFLFSKNRLNLRSFNVIDHLAEEMQTNV